jgi:bifunctional DNA-binding transcriptional regulator/antitoxin component of YhaV-PrlF toxin-antitoxin module
LQEEVLALEKVVQRGQVVLPREVQKKAGIRPGDLVYFEVLGPGRILCTVLPQLGPRELRDKFGFDQPIDLESDRPVWEEQAAKAVVGSVE